ncbi:MAG: iron ABC transporter permease [Lachnospiraceae bacterium]|nr:iron ABC transporter permease [Lachnospiraceae bacterium]
MKKAGYRSRWPFITILVILFLLLFFVIVFAVCTGSANIKAEEAIRLLLAKIPLLGQGIDCTESIINNHALIVYQVRLPRILLAMLVGMALSITGAAFQGLFRNPLADPHILGVSSGAALGATFAMLSGAGIQFLGLGAVGIAAFAGALITVFIVYQIAGIGAGRKTVHLLLTGTAISSFLSALMSLLMTRHQETLEKVYLWTLGSFSSATWDKVLFLILFVMVGALLLMLLSRELNLLSVGEDTAGTLGVSIQRVRKLIIISGSLLVAASVAVSGVIGFVGLIVPHCVRLLFGSNHERLMPASMLVGAIFMILCDTIARTVTAPSEIPVGVVTSLFGAPYFIYLLYREKAGQA